jgi:hypothetical protein
LIAILLSACATGASPSTPTPSEATAPDSPGSLPSLSPAIGCLDSPPDVEVLSAQTDPLACFGSEALTFDAQLTGAGVVDCPIVVEPIWLSCASSAALQLVGETRKVGAPFMLVAFDPASPVEIGNFTDARVTGHYDDPAAQTCHETERAPAIGGTPQPTAETIAQCRRTFVVTELIPLEE